MSDKEPTGIKHILESAVMVNEGGLYTPDLAENRKGDAKRFASGKYGCTLLLNKVNLAEDIEAFRKVIRQACINYFPPTAAERKKGSEANIAYTAQLKKFVNGRLIDVDEFNQRAAASQGGRKPFKPKPKAWEGNYVVKCSSKNPPVVLNMVLKDGKVELEPLEELNQKLIYSGVVVAAELYVQGFTSGQDGQGDGVACFINSITRWADGPRIRYGATGPSDDVIARIRQRMASVDPTADDEDDDTV